MARAHRPTSRAAAEVPLSTFILDNGAYTLKAGFAPSESIADAQALDLCETVPNCIVRSREKKTYVASQSNEITQWSEAVYRRPMENGQIVSWEAQKEVWDYSLFDEQSASSKIFIKDPADTTLVLAETPNGIPALQKNLDEIVMEEWGLGGYLRVIGPSLNAYNDLHPIFEDAEAPKAQSSLANLPMECLLIIDSGYSYTTVTPCFEGRPIQRAVRRLDFGGKHLTNLLKETISIRHFDLHQDTKIVNDIKEDTIFVSQDIRSDLDQSWKGNSRTTKLATLSPDSADVEQNSKVAELRLDYVLPDGVNITHGYPRPHDPSIAAVKKRKLALAHPDSNEIVMTLGNERFTTPEVIFTPADIGSKQPGLADCIIQSLSKVPPLIQATMVANTIVVGGNANIPGFIDRLQDELRGKVKTEWPVRVRKMADPTTSTWLGGARLASNHRPTLEKSAVTREQYNERGSSWLLRHFASVH